MIYFFFKVKTYIFGNLKFSIKILVSYFFIILQIFFFSHSSTGVLNAATIPLTQDDRLSIVASYFPNKYLRNKEFLACTNKWTQGIYTNPCNQFIEELKIFSKEYIGNMEIEFFERIIYYYLGVSKVYSIDCLNLEANNRRSCATSQDQEIKKLLKEFKDNYQ